MTTNQLSIDEFVGKFAGDLAAVLHGTTVVIGDKLGLYKGLARLGPSTPAELAAETGCDQRSVEEWLNAQAASEYCHYDPTTGRYRHSGCRRASSCRCSRSRSAPLAVRARASS